MAPLRFAEGSPDTAAKLTHAAQRSAPAESVESVGNLERDDVDQLHQQTSPSISVVVRVRPPARAAFCDAWWSGCT